MGPLVARARHLEAETDPVEALRRWLQAGVEFMATKKGIAALAMAADRFRIPQRHSALAAGTGAHAPLPSLPRTSRKVSAGSRAVCLGEYQARGWALKIVGRQPQLLLICIQFEVYPLVRTCNPCIEALATRERELPR